MRECAKDTFLEVELTSISIMEKGTDCVFVITGRYSCNHTFGEEIVIMRFFLEGIFCHIHGMIF